MFNLPELQMMLEQRNVGAPIDERRHREILTMLRYAAQSFELKFQIIGCKKGRASRLFLFVIKRLQIQHC